jgi:hypothetical protein
MERQTGYRLGTTYMREYAGKTVPRWWAYAREFPHWYVWRGVTGLYYARIPGISPQRVLRALTVDKLREEIVRYGTSRRTVALSNIPENRSHITSHSISFRCDHCPDHEAPP